MWNFPPAAVMMLVSSESIYSGPRTRFCPCRTSLLLLSGADGSLLHISHTPENLISSSYLKKQNKTICKLIASKFLVFIIWLSKIINLCNFSEWQTKAIVAPISTHIISKAVLLCAQEFSFLVLTLKKKSSPNWSLPLFWCFTEETKVLVNLRV